jgi:hypothetical protein
VSPSTISATDPATLTWSSTDASACSAGNAWAGPVATSGTQAITQSAAGTYVYEVTCTGSGGTVTKTTTLTVNAKPAPPAGGGGGGGGALGWLEFTLLALFTGSALISRRRQRVRS